MRIGNRFTSPLSKTVNQDSWIAMAYYFKPVCSRQHVLASYAISGIFWCIPIAFRIRAHKILAVVTIHAAPILIWIYWFTLATKRFSKSCANVLRCAFVHLSAPCCLSMCQRHFESLNWTGFLLVIINNTCLLLWQSPSASIDGDLITRSSQSAKVSILFI